jgi:isopentenyl phosphate kinase
MESKVMQMLELVQHDPELQIQIFSGLEPGNILRALSGESLGTWITA